MILRFLPVKPRFRVHWVAVKELAHLHSYLSWLGAKKNFATAQNPTTETKEQTNTSKHAPCYLFDLIHYTNCCFSYPWPNRSFFVTSRQGTNVLYAHPLNLSPAAPQISQPGVFSTRPPHQRLTGKTLLRSSTISG